MPKHPPHLPPAIPTQALYDLLMEWRDRMAWLQADIDKLPHNHAHRRPLEALLRSRRDCAAELSQAVNAAARRS